MTEEWLDILEASDALAAQIVQSDLAQRYFNAKRAVYEDEQLVQHIEQFLNMKERYEEVQRFGKYHPDYREVMTAVRKQKRALDLNEKIGNYRLAETKLQEMLDLVGYTLAQAVSDNVAVDSSNPFFETRSCGAGCGAGGACSCSAS